jgi:hypothetical protein
MKKALIGSWIFFAAVLGGRSIADDYIQKDGYGFMGAFVVKRIAGGMRMEHVVTLDDAEIQRIKEACK